MNLGLPIVCVMTPKFPLGTVANPNGPLPPFDGHAADVAVGGLQKPALNSTLLLGVSKLAWLKRLKNCASYFKLNRSLSLMFLNKLKLNCVWNGPRKMSRPRFPNPIS